MTGKPIPPKPETEDFTNNENKDSFQAGRRDKKLDGETTTADRRELGKYKGFWQKFQEEMSKKTAKSSSKDTK